MDPETAQTPVKDDKHFAMTLLFAATVIVNHRLALQLTLGELMVLGTALGVYTAQSQVAAWARLKTIKDASE